MSALYSWLEVLWDENAWYVEIYVESPKPGDAWSRVSQLDCSRDSSQPCAASLVTYLFPSLYSYHTITNHTNHAN